MRSGGGTALTSAAAHRRARRRDAGLSQREDVRAGKRRGAGGGAKVARVDQAVGAIGVVGLRERSAKIAQDDAFGQSVEIAVAPKARMICAASSVRPVACAARAAAIFPALDCGGRRRKMRRPWPAPADARPVRLPAGPESSRGLASSDGPRGRPQAVKDGCASARKDAHSSADRSAGSVVAVASATRPATSPLL